MSEPTPLIFPPAFDGCQDPARCLHCAYILEGLIERRCPECGRTFDPLDRDSYTRRKSFLFWPYWLPGLALAFGGGGLICFEFLINNNVGFGLTLCTPFTVGAILGYGVHAKLRVRILITMAAIVFIVGTLIFLQLAGPLCGAILVILFTIPTAVGLAVGWVLRGILKQSSFKQRAHLPVLLFLLIPPLGHVAEQRIGFQHGPESLATVRDIPASLKRVWHAQILADERQSPRSSHTLPSPAPLGMTPGRAIVGGMKNVTMNRGKLTVEITKRDEERLLAYRFIGQNHVEDRAVKLLDGSMEFQSLAPDHTRVTLTTNYQPLMTPRWYWRPFERASGRDVHNDLLDEIAVAAKGNK